MTDLCTDLGARLGLLGENPAHRDSSKPTARQ